MIRANMHIGPLFMMTYIVYNNMRSKDFMHAGERSMHAHVSGCAAESGRAAELTKVRIRAGQSLLHPIIPALGPLLDSKMKQLEFEQAK